MTEDPDHPSDPAPISHPADGPANRASPTSPDTEVGGKVDTDAPHDTPSEVRNIDSLVHMSGPDAVDVTLTAEAAARTGARLIDAAAIAKGEESIARPTRPGGRQE